MRLAIGAAQFGMHYGISNKTGKTGQKEVEAIIAIARDSHVEVIDTAVDYGDSELTLGSVGVSDFKIVTKIPYVESSGEIQRTIDKYILSSLNKLKIDQLYAALLHRPNQLLSNDGAIIFKALQSLKDQGLVKKIGVSVYKPNELSQIIENYPIDLVQIPLSIIDQRFIKTGLISQLQKKNIEIHSRSTFLQGLLLMQRESRPSQFIKWDSIWQKWHNWLLKNNLNAFEGALSFALSVEGIDYIVVGVESANQFNQVIETSGRASSLTFPDIDSDDENLINPSNWHKS